MKIFTQLRKLIYEKREKNYKTKDNVTRQAAATSEKKTSNWLIAAAFQYHWS